VAAVFLLKIVAGFGGILAAGVRDDVLDILLPSGSPDASKHGSPDLFQVKLAQLVAEASALLAKKELGSD
jgi:hypothetical protein